MATGNIRTMRELLPSEVEKFLANVDRRGVDECWPWTGHRNYAGYGVMYLSQGRNNYATHRIAYFLETGKDLDGLFACHRCDNPPCCNPNHIFPGTAKQNTEDAVRKGRIATGDRAGARKHPDTLRRGSDHWAKRNPHLSARGERQGHAKLTEQAVREIRLRSSVGHTNSEIAKDYGVRPGNIWHIVNGLSWRHVV
jgi:hypothetical protein